MAEQAAPAETKPKGRLGLLIVVGGILFGEAVIIVGAMSFMGGSAEVAPQEHATLATPEGEKITEVLVLDGRLPNAKLGVTYLYEVEIYVQVKERNAAKVTEELEQFRNEIKADIIFIWRTSDPREFQEPKLESLTRKVCALLSDRFGVDPNHSEPIISKCVIVMGTGFRIDS